MATLRDTPVPKRRDILATPTPLPRLLATAALTARGRPGAAQGHLPDRALVQRAIQVRPERVAAYCRVCEFPLSATVPITYLHVLAFPLQVSSMVEKDFPLPLPGMVHLSNEMAQLAPLAAGETVDATAWAADLRDHPNGTAVDLYGRIERDGELIWVGRSTYLRRTRRTRGTPVVSPRVVAEPARSNKPAMRWRIPGDAGRRYAQVSGDVNPIHLHPLTARLAGMPGPIAHGMWTHARSVAALGPRLPELAHVSVDFRRPVRIPSTVDVHFARAAADQRTVLVTAQGQPDRVLLATTAGPVDGQRSYDHGQ